MKLPRRVEETSRLVPPDAVNWNLVVAELAQLVAIARLTDSTTSTRP